MGICRSQGRQPGLEQVYQLVLLVAKEKKKLTSFIPVRFNVPVSIDV